MNYLADLNNWLVVAVTLAVVVTCVAVHFEVFSHCNRLLAMLSHKPRRRVLFLILTILATHVAEIWLFAGGYYFLVHVVGVGSLAGAGIEFLPDYAYFSAVVYSTVGFGDVVPLGAIRFMAGMEALTGIVMITWSASFTFLEMARDWPVTPRQ